MVNKLSIPLAHIIPVNHNDLPLPKIVHGKDPLGRRPNKESHP